MRLNDDGKTVAAADMLVLGVGEFRGGSQREERLDVLEDNIRRLGMDVENYRWYNVCAAGAALTTPASARLRADDNVHNRHGQHPRRVAVPENHRKRRLLIGAKRQSSEFRRSRNIAAPKLSY